MDSGKLKKKHTVHSLTQFFSKVAKAIFWGGKKYGTFGCVPQKYHLKYTTGTYKNVPSQNTTYKRKYDLSIKNTTRTMVERKISSVKEGTTRMGRKR